MAYDELPESWTVWSDEDDGRTVLTYRPDVFDSQQFPAACLPTLYLAGGPPNRPPGEAEVGEPSVWRVELFLEPEVQVGASRTYDSREDAVEGATELAAAFARGDVNYRDAYQLPREAYLDRLDELTGREQST